LSILLRAGGIPSYRKNMKLQPYFKEEDRQNEEREPKGKKTKCSPRVDVWIPTTAPHAREKQIGNAAQKPPSFMGKKGGEGEEGDSSYLSAISRMEKKSHNPPFFPFLAVT